MPSFLFVSHWGLNNEWEGRMSYSALHMQPDWPGIFMRPLTPCRTRKGLPDPGSVPGTGTKMGRLTPCAP